jgi:hypothetical protein
VQGAATFSLALRHLPLKFNLNLRDLNHYPTISEPGSKHVTGASQQHQQSVEVDLILLAYFYSQI